ncbi:MAG: helix-turn-helix transcriptional regulator [Cyanobacteria bacterium P01_H01_bin.105]
MKKLRERAGLSQEKFARKLDVSMGTIAKWDQMYSFPRLYPSQMQKVMEILNCTFSELQEAEQTWIKRKEKKNIEPGDSND